MTFPLRRLAWVVLAAVLLGGVAVYWHSPRALRADDEFLIEPRQGDQLGAWMNPSGAAGAWALEGGNVLQNHAVFRYTNPVSGERVTLELHHRDAVAHPALTTEQFALGVNGAELAPAELLGVLGARLRGGERDYRWIEADHHPTPPWLRKLRQLQLPVAWFLLGQSPLWLILAGRRVLAQLAPLSRGARFGILAALLAAVIVRWGLAPLRLVVLSIGYQLTAQELTLEALPRYGAGVAVFHHVLLRVFEADHLTILRAHSIIGVLMVPLVAALVLAWVQRPVAAVAAAFLWALVPAFIAHDNSEANTVPLLFWLVSGLVLWLDARDRGGALSLFGAVALFALAVVGRPEFPVLVPVAALGLALGSGRPSRLPWGAVLPLALAIGLLAIPHLVHVGESAALLAARDSLPLGRSVLGANRVSVLDPSLYPLGLLAFAVAALVLPGARRAAAFVLAVATLGFVLTWVDVDPANVLRVQVPGALFYALGVALGIASALQFAERRLAHGAAIGIAVHPRVDQNKGRDPFVPSGVEGFAPNRTEGRPSTPLGVNGDGLYFDRRSFGLAATGAVVLVALSAIPCLPASFARTNEDEEEAFIRVVARALPAGDFQLVRLDYGDVKGSLSGSPVHLYFPDYLFGRSVRGMSDWLRDPSHPAAYLYVGTRCYTPEHPFHPGEAPDTVPLRDVCQQLLDHHVSDVVTEQVVVSHGDPLRTGFYGTAVGAPMKLGLYRLRAGP